MKIINYEQRWDYHFQYHTTIILEDKYVASGYIRETESEVIIAGIYVAPEFRGQGYGKMITKLILQNVNKLDYKEIWLMVKKTNSIAIKLYTKLGFSIEKDDENGVYHWMHLTLTIK